MCAVACIAGAIVFGDLDDPASAVARLIAAGDARPLMPECGTRPSVYYLLPDRQPAVPALSTPATTRRIP
jgi:tetrathionate reductase subunit B